MCQYVIWVKKKQKRTVNQDFIDDLCRCFLRTLNSMRLLRKIACADSSSAPFACLPMAFFASAIAFWISSSLISSACIARETSTETEPPDTSINPPPIARKYSRSLVMIFTSPSARAVKSGMWLARTPIIPSIVGAYTAITSSEKASRSGVMMESLKVLDIRV